MNKKMFYPLVMAFFINTAISQDKDSIRLMLEFKMTHVVDTTQPLNPQIGRYMLLVGSGMSQYEDYYLAMSLIGTPVTRTFTDASGTTRTATVGGVGDQLYTDFAKQVLITVTYLVDNLYAKEDSLTKIKWMIQPQKKEILKYQCQMATATFKGRNYTAWFAPTFANAAGPWKLNGLPGIILAANDDKNEISFECVKIMAPPEKAPPIAISGRATRISAEKFKKVKYALETDPMAGRGANTQTDGRLVATTIGGGSAQPAARPKIMNNPIEKE